MKGGGGEGDKRGKRGLGAKVDGGWRELQGGGEGFFFFFSFFLEGGEYFRKRECIFIGPNIFEKRRVCP